MFLNQPGAVYITWNNFIEKWLISNCEEENNLNLQFLSFYNNLIFKKSSRRAVFRGFRELRGDASGVEPGHPANVKCNWCESIKSNFSVNHIKYFQALLPLWRRKASCREEATSCTSCTRKQPLKNVLNNINRPSFGDLSKSLENILNWTWSMDLNSSVPSTIAWI